MSEVSRSLPPLEGLPPSERFWDLFDRAMERAAQLCGAVWTDYNAHDPGVTIVEQLCYAVTELGYRTQLPIEDLLRAAGGELDRGALGLFSPRRMLPTAPLTPADLARLMLDRLPGVQGAWVEPGSSAGGGGLDVRLYAPGLGADADARRRLRRAAARLAERRRNLCDRSARVTVLRERGVSLAAHVDLAAGAVPEQAVAALLRRLELKLAPEVIRLDLAATPEAGARPSVVLEGPALRNGWIDLAPLTPPPREIALTELMDAMASSSDVQAVHGLEFEGVERIGDPARLRPPAGAVLTLDLVADRCIAGLEVRVGGAPVALDVERVRAALHRLRVEGRMARPLWRSLGERLVVEAGASSAGAVFSSVGADLPGAYGLREAGSAEPPHTRQLRGYLLGFDLQILKTFAMIDALSVIDRDAVQRAGDTFGAKLRAELPGVSALLDQPAEVARGDSLTRELAREDRLRRRLALYGRSPLEPTPAAGLDAALAWAARRPGSQRRAPQTSSRGLRRSDLERALAIDHQVGLARTPLAEGLDSSGVALVATGGDLLFDGRAPQPLDHVEFEDLIPVDEGNSTARLRSGRLLAPTSLLDAGCEVRLGRVRGRSWRVVLKSGERAWEIDRLDDPDAASEMARRLHGSLRAARAAAERVHLLEHQRLRSARRSGDAFPYDATFTLVVCAPGRTGSSGFRRAVAEDVRRLAPAHLVAQTAFLDVEALARLESLLAGGVRLGAEPRRRNARALVDWLAGLTLEPSP